MKNVLRISIAAVIIAVALAVMFPAGAGPVFAQQPDEPSRFDMTTDSDGNGIPDDFENAYRELMGPPAGASGQQAAGGGFDSAAMGRFVNRIPVSAETQRLRNQIDAKTQELQSATSESRQIELLRQIRDLSDRMARNDPALSAALGYLDRLEPQSAPPSSASPPSGASGAGGVGGASSEDFTVQMYEDRINRRGDIMFVDRPGVNSVTWVWAKSWEHVGMYDGSRMVYDSDVGFGCSGVDRRAITKFIKNRNRIQYMQLANSSGRSSVGGALTRAINTYGINCRTPYNYNFLNKNTNSKMYCSQLVWKTYLDLGGGYSVDLNSNNIVYLAWLAIRYTPRVARTVGITAIAPDEIAMADRELDRYYYENSVMIRPRQ